MKKETIYYIILWAIFGFFRLVIHFSKHGKIKSKTNDNVAVTMVLPYMLSVIAAVFEFELRQISLNAIISSIGILLFVFGSVVQFRGLMKLGAHFSNAVELQNNHNLIQTGIYRTIRHPIYLGIILQGFSSILLLNVISPAVFMIISTFGVLCRIKSEENYLANNLTGYKEYMKRSNALVPRFF